MARGQSRAQSEATPSPAKLAAEARDAANEAAFKTLPAGTQFRMFDDPDDDPKVGGNAKSADDVYTIIADYVGSEDPEDIISLLTDDFKKDNQDFVKKLEQAKENATEDGEQEYLAPFQSRTAIEPRYEYSFGDGESGRYKSVLKFPNAPSVEVEFSVGMKVKYSQDRDGDEDVSTTYRTSIKGIKIL